MSLWPAARWTSFLALLIAVAPAAPAAELQPAFEVRWPPGWTVSQRPGPAACGQASLMARAVKEQPGSAPLAVVQVLQLMRCDGGKATLEEETASAVRMVHEQYEAAGLAVKVGSPRPTTLGGLPALEVEIGVSGPKVALQITQAMALGRQHVFAFTFAAAQSDQARFQPTVQSTLSSLKLH